MSVQIKINDLELLELAKISTSLTDLSRKLKIRPNNKKLMNKVTLVLQEK